MLRTRLVVSKALVAMMVLGAGSVSGQDASTGLRTGFPNKPLRIVTNGAGAGTDIQARIIGQLLTSNWGQPVLIENRAGGVTLAETVSRAQPDGYTLHLVGGSFILGPLLEKTSYDPVRDFSPISLISKAPYVLVVQPSFPANSVKELIALAKAKPGALNYGSGPTGGGPHLSAELLKAMAGVNIVRIPYKNNGQAVNALLGGELQMVISGAPTVMPLVKSGKVRALAVTTTQPSALAPGLPTVAASGLPGYESESLTILVVPAKTPATIVTRLNQEIVRALNRPDVKEKFFNNGSEVVASSPEQLAARIKSEIESMGKVIKDAGIKAE